MEQVVISSTHGTPGGYGTVHQLAAYSNTGKKGTGVYYFYENQIILVHSHCLFYSNISLIVYNCFLKVVLIKKVV